MLIVTFLSSMHALIAGFSDIELSKSYSGQEDFWFWNIKDQMTRTFDNRPCPILAEDFKEIKMITEEYLGGRGVEFDISNTTVICPPALPGNRVEIEMSMISTGITIYDIFNLTVANP